MFQKFLKVNTKLITSVLVCALMASTAYAYDVDVSSEQAGTAPVYNIDIEQGVSVPSASNIQVNITGGATNYDVSIKVDDNTVNACGTNVATNTSVAATAKSVQPTTTVDVTKSAKQQTKATKTKATNESSNTVNVSKSTKTSRKITGTVNRKDALPALYGKLGTFKCDKLGISLSIVWDGEQRHVDAVNSGYANGAAGLPGDMSRYCIIGDHNHQSGKILAEGLVPGDTVTFKTSYGNFTYAYKGYKVATIVNNMVAVPSRIVSQNNLWYANTMDDYILDGYSVLKRSWNAEYSSQNAGKLYFRTCYPLTANITNKVALLEFDMVSGPKLIG